MQPDRWHQVREVLADVIEAPPGIRPALIDAACTTDAALRKDLTSVLATDVDRLLALPAAPALAEAVRGGDADDRTSHDALLSPGASVGPYEIVSLLGSGGMGEVYLARDRRLFRDVALKRLASRFAASPSMRARTLVEARAAARLDHANIAPVHDVIEQDDGTVIIVMEHVAGESLAARLRRGPLGVRAAVDIAREIADALEHAHGAGIVHCDIKPGNIQLTSRGGVKVLDFGIAHSIVHPADAPTGTAVAPPRFAGTPGYMSPEQSLGLPIDVRSDLFSLGVVLFEMMAGRRPFEAGHRGLEPVHAVLGDAPDLAALPRSVPAALRRILERLLQRDPNQRFQAAGDLRDALEQVHRALGGGPLTRLRQMASRRPVASAAIGAALALAMAAGVALWRSSQAPSSRPIDPAAARWYSDGVAALQEGAYLQASRLLERAARIDGSYALTWARLGDAQLELDQESAARQSLLKAAALVPDRSRMPPDDRLALEAAMAMAGRDRTGALRAYERLVERHPGSAPLLIDLGRAHEARNETAEAVRSYRRATELDQDNPAAFLRLGILSARQGDMTEAGAALARAEDLYTLRGRTEGVAAVSYERGVMLQRAGRNADAFAALERARQLAASVDSQYLLAAIGFKMSSVAVMDGRAADAEMLAADARRLGGSYPGLSAFGLVDLGNVYISDGRLDRAEAAFREAVEKARAAGAARAEARAHLALASVLEARGTAAEMTAEATAALRYYEQTGFVAQERVARTVLGRAREREGDLAGAEASYEAIIKAAGTGGDPKGIAEAQYSLAAVLLRAEQYAAALQHCDVSLASFRALKMPRDVAHAMLTRSAILLGMGRFDEAEAEVARLFQPDTGSGTGSPDGERRRALARARLALARGDATGAARIAGGLADAGEDDDPAANSEIQLVLARAAIRTRRPADAMQPIQRAAAAAKAAGDPVLAQTVDLARADALLESGRHADALKAAGPLADALHAHPRHESAWFAAAIAARSARALRRAPEATRWAAIAVEEQSAVLAQFDDTGRRTYMQRAEVSRFQRGADE